MKLILIVLFISYNSYALIMREPGQFQKRNCYHYFPRERGFLSNAFGLHFLRRFLSTSTKIQAALDNCYGQKYTVTRFFFFQRKRPMKYSKEFCAQMIKMNEEGRLCRDKTEKEKEIAKKKKIPFYRMNDRVFLSDKEINQIPIEDFEKGPTLYKNRCPEKKDFNDGH